MVDYSNDYDLLLDGIASGFAKHNNKEDSPSSKQNPQQPCATRYQMKCKTPLKEVVLKTRNCIHHVDFRHRLLALSLQKITPIEFAWNGTLDQNAEKVLGKGTKHCELDSLWLSFQLIIVVGGSHSHHAQSQARANEQTSTRQLWLFLQWAFYQANCHIAWYMILHFHGNIKRKNVSWSDPSFHMWLPWGILDSNSICIYAW